MDCSQSKSLISQVASRLTLRPNCSSSSSLWWPSSSFSPSPWRLCSSQFTADEDVTASHSLRCWRHLPIMRIPSCEAPSWRSCDVLCPRISDSTERWGMCEMELKFFVENDRILMNFYLPGFAGLVGDCYSRTFVCFSACYMSPCFGRAVDIFPQDKPHVWFSKNDF